MKTTLLYGRQGLPIEVPDHAVILEPQDIPGLPDEQLAVLDALRNPIGTPALKDMVKTTDNVAIVISDITHPTPNQAVIQVWADVYVHSSLPDEDVRKAMLQPIHSMADTLQQLKEKYGESMSVAVLPQGPFTIPYVIE